MPAPSKPDPARPVQDPKVENYRETLHRLAKHGRKPAAETPEARDLEGKAAKLGTEIQDEQSKAPPHADRRPRGARKR